MWCGWTPGLVSGGDGVDGPTPWPCPNPPGDVPPRHALPVQRWLPLLIPPPTYAHSTAGWDVCLSAPRMWQDMQHRGLSRQHPSVLSRQHDPLVSSKGVWVLYGTEGDLDTQWGEDATHCLWHPLHVGQCDHWALRITSIHRPGAGLHQVVVYHSFGVTIGGEGLPEVFHLFILVQH